MINSSYHTPVLLQETIEALNILPSHWYVDCTLGGGSHSLGILEKGGSVLGIDQDKDAILQASQFLSQYSKDRLIIYKANFKDLKKIISKINLKISGILFDLGVSSYQLSGQNRGFSFQKNEKLDMRMDPDSQKVMARDLINGLWEKELAQLIKVYGEDPLAERIAKTIVKYRKLKRIETTRQLAEIISEVYQQRYLEKSKLHPATKTFQALRIAVNDELNILRQGLDQAIKILSKNGRIVVISFHGLEDKIVKDKFEEFEKNKLGVVVNREVIWASSAEVLKNPRSRSAKLQIFEKKIEL